MQGICTETLWDIHHVRYTSWMMRRVNNQYKDVTFQGMPGKAGLCSKYSKQNSMIISYKDVP
jgi:hypothetical protein